MSPKDLRMCESLSSDPAARTSLIHVKINPIGRKLGNG
jgi:hypothetical protein